MRPLLVRPPRASQGAALCEGRHHEALDEVFTWTPLAAELKKGLSFWVQETWDETTLAHWGLGNMMECIETCDSAESVFLF